MEERNEIQEYASTFNSTAQAAGYESTDAALFSGKAAWHGYGAVVEDIENTEQCLIDSGLDWEVTKEPMGYYKEDPETGDPYFVETDFFGIVRADTGVCFQAVGDGYHVFQNRELFELASELKEATPDSAFSLGGGRKVVLNMKLGEFGLGINREDVQQTFGVFTTSHDGTGSLEIRPSSFRPECANMLMLALSSARKKKAGYVIRHTANMRATAATTIPSRDSGCTRR